MYTSKRLDSTQNLISEDVSERRRALSLSSSSFIFKHLFASGSIRNGRKTSFQSKAETEEKRYSIRLKLAALRCTPEAFYRVDRLYVQAVFGQQCMQTGEKTGRSADA